MKSLQRILAIVRKEVRQLRRDRLTFGMIVGIPVIQLLMFGYAINMDVRNIEAAVVDLSGTSASRQVVMDMAQAFLLTDAIFKLYVNITSDMVVYPKQIEKHLRSELPFMATEEILMRGVQEGGDRQDLHEKVRVLAIEAERTVVFDRPEMVRLANKHQIAVICE